MGISNIEENENVRINKPNNMLSWEMWSPGSITQVKIFHSSTLVCAVSVVTVITQILLWEWLPDIGKNSSSIVFEQPTVYPYI